MICLILAGGFGRRLWPLTENRAKSLLIVNGEEIITTIIKKIPEDIHIYISTNRRFEKDFLEWKKRMGRHMEIFVEDAHEEKEKLGAMSAVSYFLKKNSINDNLLLIGGDNLFYFNLSTFLKGYKGHPLVAVHDIKDSKKACHYGVVRLSGGRIVSLEEKPQHPSSTLISTACYLFPKETFSRIHEFCTTRKDNLGEFLSYLAKKEDVYAFVFEEEWFDVGSFDSYFEAHTKMSANVFPQSVRFVGKNDIKGKVYLGENCIVVDSHIENSIIFDNSLIEKSHVVNCMIDGGSIIRDVKIENQIVKGSP